MVSQLSPGSGLRKAGTMEDHQLSSEINDQRPPVSRSPAAIALFLGMVLLVAGTLKTMSGGYAEGSRFLVDSQWAALVSVGVEVGVGLWLISGAWAKKARAVAAALFLTLAVLALREAMLGKESCGCFGNLIRVSPWVTFAFDLCAVAGLGWSSTRQSNNQAALARQAAYAYFCVAGFVVAIGASVAVKTFFGSAS